MQDHCLLTFHLGMVFHFITNSMTHEFVLNWRSPSSASGFPPLVLGVFVRPIGINVGYHSSLDLRMFLLFNLSSETAFINLFVSVMRLM